MKILKNSLFKNIVWEQFVCFCVTSFVNSQFVFSSTILLKKLIYRLKLPFIEIIFYPRIIKIFIFTGAIFVHFEISNSFPWKYFFFYFFSIFIFIWNMNTFFFFTIHIFFSMYLVIRLDTILGLLYLIVHIEMCLCM